MCVHYKLLFDEITITQHTAAASPAPFKYIQKSIYRCVSALHICY